jgi:PAS domain S-box-containing protein
MFELKDRPAARRYSVALVAPLAVAGLMQLTWPFFESTPAAIYLLAVTAAAWYGGLGPGLLTVALSLLLADYFFIRPYNSLRLSDGSDLAYLVTLATAGPLVSLMCEVAHRARRRDAALVGSLREREEELRDSRARLSGIIGSAMDAVITVDERQRIVLFNEAAERMFGVPADRAVGEHLGRFIPDRFREAHARHVEQFGRTGVTRRQMGHLGAISGLRADGEEFPVEASISQLEAGGRKLYTVIMRDITERMRAESDLRESEERLQIVIENLADGLVIADTTGRILHWNRAGLAMHGFGSAEEVRIQLTEFARSFELSTLGGRAIPVDEWPLTRVLRGEPVRDLELRVRRLDTGWRRVFKYGGTIISDPAGGRLGILTINDITERKQAEEELRKSEERYRDVVENARDLIYTHDLEGNYLSVNRAVERVTGYTREDVAGMSLEQIVAPEYVEKARRMIAEKLAGKSETTYDLEIVAKDGRRIAVEVNTRLVYEGGAPVGVQGIARDITERRRAEETRARRAAQAAMRAEINAALAEAGTPLAAILERSVAAMVRHLGLALARVWTLSRDGNVLELQASAGLYTRTDGAYSRIPVGELKIGLVAAERRPHIINDVRNDPLFGEKEWARREGVRSFAGYPLLVEGRLIGALGTFSGQRFTDDTLDALASAADVISQGIERRRAEEALRESEEQFRQVQKLEAVGRLAGGVAHDFNNLLTVINGYSGLLMRRFERDESARRKIEEIEKAGRRAAELTGQLLAFSRKQVLQPKVISLNAVVADLDKMLRRLIGEDVELTPVLDPALGNVLADPGQIVQVIMNLAVNARDAMPQGGKLTVETANVRLDGDYAAHHLAVQPGDYVLLSVTDTGTGMTEEVRSRIFEPFFTTKEKGKGTGLGLSTVYGIVKQSGGSIWVYSEVGCGTTFKIYLPRVDREARGEEERAATRAQSASGTETILLVEDEEPVRLLARAVLEREGYTVVAARCGADAERVFEESDRGIDLLLTDVVMPGVSGPQLARRLCERRPGLKVIYMSGYTDDAVVRHGLLGGEVVFVQKPFTPDSLARKVRETLDAPGRGAGPAADQ